MTSRIDLYYDGNLGDPGNVDWFFAGSDMQLRDITSVDIETSPAGTIVEITYQQGLVVTGFIVKNPKQHTNGTVAPKFTGADYGIDVWVGDGSAPRKKATLLRCVRSMIEVTFPGVGGSVSAFSERHVHRNEVDGTGPKFGPKDIGTPVWCDMQPGAMREPGYLTNVLVATVSVQLDNGQNIQLSDTAVHRAPDGTPPMPHDGDKVYGTAPVRDDKPKKRTEAERMKDFFRGKDTW